MFSTASPSRSQALVASIVLFTLLPCGPVAADRLLGSGPRSEHGAFVWTPLEQAPSAMGLKGDLVAKAESFRMVQLAQPGLGLTSLPPGLEQAVELPFVDGTNGRFVATVSQTMSPELAARFPEIRSYNLRGVDDPSQVGVLDVSPAGLHAMVRSAGRTLRIDPLPGAAAGQFMTYDERDFVDPADHYCGVEDAFVLDPLVGSDPLVGASPPSPLMIPSGTELRTYRLAVATTGEYYAARGGTDASVLASIVTEVSRVNLMYGSELAINLTLIGNTDDLFWTDPVADPFTDGAPCTMNNEGANAIDATIGAGAYDIGHLFGAVASGGCAGGAVVCTDVNKGIGATTFRTDGAHPAGHEDFGGYRLMMHEVGHQFGAGHTWNGNSGNCTNAQYSMISAYEPSSGTTVMSYSGTCGVDNIQAGVQETYFHTFSFDQIVNYTTIGTGSTCPTVGPSGNSPPDVDAGPDYTIPWRTPFVLTGSATDPDGDSLTYCWEQFDQAAGRLGPLVDDGIGPLFRSFPPGPSPVRTVPQLSTILSSGPDPVGEKLAGNARTITFRLTARDNQSTGGVDYDTMVIDVVSPSFSVTEPDPGDVVVAGCVSSVEWSEGTDELSANVNILFSEDGGLTFTPLLMNTPNDGQEDVEFPCVDTDMARIKVEAVENIFFNISTGDFEVRESQPIVDMNVFGGPVDESCMRLVTFEGTVTDDCGVDAEDVDLGASNPDGNATVGLADWDVDQINDTTLEITGSVLVSDLTACPAEIVINTLAFDACNSVGVSQVAVEVTDDIEPQLIDLPPDMVVECDAVPAPAMVSAMDGCDGAPDLQFHENEIPGDCPGNSTLERTWTATDFCGNVSEHVQTIIVEDTTPPEVLGVLVPVPPLVPQPPAGPGSVCSAPTSRLFTVTCSIEDNCDPDPMLTANLMVATYDVSSGSCEPLVDFVPVECGEVVELRLAAAPCPPASPNSALAPQSPHQPFSVNSMGIKVVSGQDIVLQVVGEDGCGNVSIVNFDPSREADPDCGEVLDDDSCCPAIAHPPSDCDDPCSPEDFEDLLNEGPFPVSPDNMSTEELGASEGERGPNRRGAEPSLRSTRPGDGPGSTTTRTDRHRSEPSRRTR